MGIFNWASKAPKKVVKYGEKVVGSEDLKKNATFIADMAKSITPASKRSETFENAYARLNLTEEDLAGSYKFYEWRFNIFIGFCSLGLLLMLLSLFKGQIMSSVALLSFSFVCLSQMFNASFRMYQIRRRELVSIQEWFRHKEEWWPKPFQSQPRSSSRSIQDSSKKPPLKK